MSKQIIILSIFLAAFYSAFSVAGEIQLKEEDADDLSGSIISKIEGHELHILNASTKAYNIDKAEIDVPSLVHKLILIKAFKLEISYNAGSFTLPLLGTPAFFYVLINAP